MSQYNMQDFSQRDPWPSLPVMFTVTADMCNDGKEIHVELPKEFENHRVSVGRVENGLWYFHIGNEGIDIKDGPADTAFCRIPISLLPELRFRKVAQSYWNSQRKGSRIFLGKMFDHLAVPQERIEQQEQSEAERQRRMDALKASQQPKLTLQAKPTPMPEPKKMEQPIPAAPQPEKEADDMQPKIKKDAEYIYAPVNYIRKLYEALGNNAEAVGRAIGTTGTTINGALRDGRIRKVNEEAARGIYEREFADKPAPQLAPPPAPVEKSDDIAKIKQALVLLNGVIKEKGMTPFIKEDGSIGLKMVVVSEF